MFHLAGKLGKRIGEIEEMSARELLEWAAYENLANPDYKPEQTPEEMLLEAKRITAGAHGRPAGR